MASPAVVDQSVIDVSTSGGTVVPLSRGIEIKPSNSSELLSHVGVMNTIDPYLHENYISKANFTWNTAQLPGTCLWYAKIHPDECNELVAYITKIYNAWVGSIEFKIKIAATGFHAGSLVCVRLPPNIHPNDVTNPNQFTTFPHTQIDVKTLETFTKDIMDQRQMLFHYRDDDPKLYTSFGGYYAVYVMLPLSTSSTGATQVNCNVWSRAGSDFRVSQPRPVSIVKTPTTGLEGFGQAFVLPSSAMTNTAVTALFVGNASIAAPGNTTFGLCDVTGKDYTADPIWRLDNPEAPFAFSFTAPTATSISYVSSSTSAIPITNPRPLVLGTGTSKPAGFTVDPTFIAPASGTTNVVATNPVNGFIKLFGTAAPQAVTATPPFNVAQSPLLAVNPSAMVRATAANSGLVIPADLPAIPGETYVFFNDSFNVSATDSLVTKEFVELAHAKNLFAIDPQQCVIFVYEDAAGKPLRYFKMYYGGYMTTVTPAASFVLTMRDGATLRPVSIGLAATPLPSQVGASAYAASVGNLHTLTEFNDLRAQLAAFRFALGL